MDFKLVLERLLNAFERENIRYALMGGFAMGLWGAGRTTVDVDFLVNRDDMQKVDAIMNQLDYECKYRSENVLQYVSPLKIFGEVDFLHAFREASLQMLQRAEEKEVFGAIKIKSLIPEDLIGLKLQAIKNNPERQQSEMEDIMFLVEYYRDRMDWSLIEQYARILEMEELYKEICKKR
jgi:predicted nucleotidyltransferase